MKGQLYRVQTESTINSLPSYIQAEIELAARVIDVYDRLHRKEITEDQAVQDIRRIRMYRDNTNDSSLNMKS